MEVCRGLSGCVGLCVSGWEACVGHVLACVRRVCWARVGIARSALLSGYLGKSGHLPRYFCGWTGSLVLDVSNSITIRKTVHEFVIFGVSLFRYAFR